jgi:YfiH family protein
VRFTGRSEGDVGPAASPAAEADRRRRSLLDRPWIWVRQVHGADVVHIEDGDDLVGQPADALVTTRRDITLAIFTADCAPIALASPEGVIGAIHAGWRGLAGGVIEATVERLRRLGATEVVAALGPCIHPGCYEFSPADLDVVARRLGPVVQSVTADGRPALDLPTAVRTSLAALDVNLMAEDATCTACSPAYFSHRARRDMGRQSALVWLP